MVTAALDALVGGDPGDDAVAAAITTIPAPELPGALRLLARAHGAAALPVLRRCLAGRPEWTMAAAPALATLPTPEAAAMLAAAEATAGTKAARTAIRRALYRLRQAGVSPPASPGPPRGAAARPEPRQAWASGLDGTGTRGVWLVLEGRFGERTLLSAIVNDLSGVVNFAAEPISTRRLDDRLRHLRAESPLPVVELPPAWALALLVEASGRHVETGSPLPGDLPRWLTALALPEAPGPAPIHVRIPPEAVADPALLERSAELLTLPDLAGWFLEPASVQGEALELLQARESRLVVSDQVKAERVAALVDRVIEAHVGPDARRRWQRRLEEEAFVLLQSDRPTEARQAVAVLHALADAARPARHIPWVRALVEKSLEVAGEVALGRVPADEVSRAPKPALPVAPAP